MAAHLARLQFADQPPERDLAFEFVAVIAGHQQHPRSGAAADGGNRDRDPAIGRAVHRMGQAKKSGLLAVAVEIDVGRKARAGGGHAVLLRGTNSRSVSRS